MVKSFIDRILGKTAKDRIYNIIVYILATLVALITLYPFLDNILCLSKFLALFRLVSSLLNNLAINIIYF